MAGVAAAEGPVGSLTAVGPILLDGAPVAKGAAQALTVFSGDEVTTKDYKATLLLPGRSRVVVAPNSRVRVAREGKQTGVSLEKGSLTFQKGEGDPLRIEAGGNQVLPEAKSEGTVSWREPAVIGATAFLGTVRLVQPGKNELVLGPGRTAILPIGRTEAAVVSEASQGDGQGPPSPFPGRGRPCEVSASSPAASHCHCPPPSDHTTPLDDPPGDFNCGKGNGP
jgi:ferric-dicitrate binding protein FerR (iron transport regulator)